MQAEIVASIWTLLHETVVGGEQEPCVEGSL